MRKMTRDEVLGIVRELHGHLDVIYGDRLKGVYLYGSYARGDARWDSDIDVAIVLSGKVKRSAEIQRLKEIVPDMCLNYNCMILPLFFSAEEFQTGKFAISRNIAAEGVSV